jgi:hypothetical protein
MKFIEPYHFIFLVMMSEKSRKKKLIPFQIDKSEPKLLRKYSHAEKIKDKVKDK